MNNQLIINNYKNIEEKSMTQVAFEPKNISFWNKSIYSAKNH